MAVNFIEYKKQWKKRLNFDSIVFCLTYGFMIGFNYRKDANDDF